MEADAIVADEPAEAIATRDESLSPIRTLDRERTFRLRDGAIAMVAAVGICLASLAALVYAPLPDVLQGRSNWAVAIAEVCAASLVLAFAVWRKIRIRDLFVYRSCWYVETFWGLAAALTGWSVFAALAWLGLRPVDPLIAEMRHADLAMRWELLIIGAVLAPLGEELLFRGALQSSFYARGGIVACLLPAALFGAIHVRGWQVAVAAGIAGLVLGALALWRRSLLAPIVAHAVWNGVFGIWLIVGWHLSQHAPAATMDEARVPPYWAHQPPTFGIELENSAEAQYFAADEQYGPRGWALPKDEIRALRLVRERFPEDDEYKEWAALRIAEIYRFELSDPRRSLAVAEEILRETDDRSAKALALGAMACAYSDLGQTDAAFAMVGRIERDYSDLETTAEDVARLRWWIEEGAASERIGGESERLAR